MEMIIKQKYVKRVVNAVDIEVSNIFQLDDELDVSYDMEMIIENHVVDMLEDIKELVNRTTVLLNSKGNNEGV